MPRGRPKKDPALRMDEDLRIPVTAEQKRIIVEAAEADHSDMTAWIRPIVLRAAERRISKNGKKTK